MKLKLKALLISLGVATAIITSLIIFVGWIILSDYLFDNVFLEISFILSPICLILFYVLYKESLEHLLLQEELKKWKNLRK